MLLKYLNLILSISFAILFAFVYLITPALSDKSDESAVRSKSPLQQVIDRSVNQLSLERNVILDVIGGGTTDGKYRILGLNFVAAKDPELHEMRRDILSAITIIKNNIEQNPDSNLEFLDGIALDAVSIGIRYTGSPLVMEGKQRHGASIYVPKSMVLFYECDINRNGVKQWEVRESLEESQRRLTLSDGLKLCNARADESAADPEHNVFTTR